MERFFTESGLSVVPSARNCAQEPSESKSAAIHMKRKREGNGCAPGRARPDLQRNAPLADPASPARLYHDGGPYWPDVLLNGGKHPADRAVMDEAIKALDCFAGTASAGNKGCQDLTRLTISG